MRSSKDMWDAIADDQEKHIKYWLALHPNRTADDAYEALYGCNEQEMSELLERAVPTTLT